MTTTIIITVLLDIGINGMAIRTIAKIKIPKKVPRIRFLSVYFKSSINGTIIETVTKKQPFGKGQIEKHC